jgi:hypothetical protein
MYQLRIDHTSLRRFRVFLFEKNEVIGTENCILCQSDGDTMLYVFKDEKHYTRVLKEYIQFKLTDCM